MSPARARELLSYPADVELLDAALADAARSGAELPERTWPLVVVRHAHAVKRADWQGGEAERPLLDRGSRAVAATWRRCWPASTCASW